MSSLQAKMQKSFAAHQNFKNVWRDWRSGRLKDVKGEKPHTEPQAITEARNEFWAANDELFSLKIQPIEKNFKKNPSDSLEEVLEFLSIDITAFRCGYAKEFFLKGLKQTSFSESESEKIKSMIVDVCKTKSFRREFRRWSSLAVKIADSNLVESLQNLVKSECHFARVKSRWILEAICRNRMDLREKVNGN